MGDGLDIFKRPSIQIVIEQYLDEISSEPRPNNLRIARRWEKVSGALEQAYKAANVSATESGTEEFIREAWNKTTDVAEAHTYRQQKKKRAELLSFVLEHTTKKVSE